MLHITPRRFTRLQARYLSNIIKRTEGTFQCRELRAESVSMEHPTVVVLDAAMLCPEYKRLRTEYEAALQQWGSVLLAQHAGPLIGDVQSGLRYRKYAADERDAANKRLEDHKRSCAVCNEAIRQFHKKS